MYYLAIIQNFGESKALYSYNSYEEALAAYHTELAYRHESRKQTVCSILNADGQVLRNEVYTAPKAPEAEPEAELEPNEEAVGG